MYTLYLLEGLAIGFSIAAPVGPIGILCIERTLSSGRKTGFVSGLGAATADSCYGLVAGLGLSVISDFLLGNQLWVRCIGGLVLCYFACNIFRAKTILQPLGTQKINLWKAYLSSFILTITNPMTLLAFLAIFAGIGFVDAGSNYLTATLLFTGVFLGSALWWLTLSGIVSSLRSRLTPRRLLLINRFFGIIVGIFGFAAILSLLF